MFRNALRQSSRSVAAVQATGRIASVSSLQPGPSDSSPVQPFSISNSSSIGPRIPVHHRANPLSILRSLNPSTSPSLTNFSPCCRFARLSPAPSPVPPSRSALTPLRLRLPLLRSPPSWSSVSVVFRRRLVSPRLVVFCRSGMSFPP